MKRTIVFIATFLLLINFVRAQRPLNLKDSLALVDLYNSTNGPQWTNNTNWLVTKARYWYGVSIDTNSNNGFNENTVGAIYLNNNNLTGHLPLSIGNFRWLTVLSLENNFINDTIPNTVGRLKRMDTFLLFGNQLSGHFPDSLCRLRTYLNNISLYNNKLSGSIPDSVVLIDNLIDLLIFNNQFDGMPDMSGMPYNWTLNLHCQNNRMTFEDIEPNMPLALYGITSQYYSPQDSVYKAIDTTLENDAGYSISSLIGGTHNRYQWSRNGVDIIGATDSVLNFNSVAVADSGVYTCAVTNTLVPGLTIYRRPVTLHIVDRITGVGDEGQQRDRCRVYPSPASEQFFIDLAFNKETAVKIQMYDILGNLIQLVDEATYAYKRLTVNTSEIPEGVYFIHITTPEKRIVEKIVVMK